MRFSSWCPGLGLLPEILPAGPRDGAGLHCPGGRSGRTVFLDADSQIHCKHKHTHSRYSAQPREETQGWVTDDTRFTHQRHRAHGPIAITLQSRGWLSAVPDPTPPGREEQKVRGGRCGGKPHQVLHSPGSGPGPPASPQGPLRRIIPMSPGRQGLGRSLGSASRRGCSALGLLAPGWVLCYGARLVHWGV